MIYYKTQLSFGWVYIRIQDDKWQAWHENLGGWCGSEGPKEEQGGTISRVVKDLWSEDFSDIQGRGIWLEVTQLEVLVVLGSKAVDE